MPEHIWVQTAAGEICGACRIERSRVMGARSRVCEVEPADAIRRLHAELECASRLMVRDGWRRSDGSGYEYTVWGKNEYDLKEVIVSARVRQGVRIWDKVFLPTYEILDFREKSWSETSRMEARTLLEAVELAEESLAVLGLFPESSADNETPEV